MQLWLILTNYPIDILMKFILLTTENCYCNVIKKLADASFYPHNVES